MTDSLPIPTHTPRTTTTYPIVTLKTDPLALGMMKRNPKEMTIKVRSGDRTTRDIHGNSEQIPQTIDRHLRHRMIRLRPRVMTGLLVSHSILTAVVTRISSDGPSRMGRIAIIRDIGAVTYVPTVLYQLVLDPC